MKIRRKKDVYLPDNLLEAIKTLNEYYSDLPIDARNEADLEMDTDAYGDLDIFITYEDEETEGESLIREGREISQRKMEIETLKRLKEKYETSTEN